MDVSSLNTEQKKAVQSTGPVIINAGPGTGKTKTLVSRIQYLISEKKIKPEHILALTFTHKAAAEMKERLQTVTTSQPLITTFHSLGHDILSTIHENIKLITEKEREVLLKELVQKKLHATLLAKMPMKEISLLLSLHKNGVTSDKSEIAQLLDLYNQTLHQKNLFDFDDLLVQTLSLLKDDATKRQDLQSRFQYILVDEFQDTNELQYEIIKQLLNKDQNLFVIGDPLQSIYSFRGANSKIFETMKKDFPSYKEITLTVNYRSVPEVITASSRLFPETPALQPHTETNGEVRLVKTLHEFTEAEWIVNTICEKMGGVDLLQSGENKSTHDTKACFSDFAVIYRTHQLSRVLEEKFSESGIPYQIIGGNSPYEQPEVEFIINTLTYLQNKDEPIFSQLVKSSLPKMTQSTISLKLQELKTQPTLSKTVQAIIKTFDFVNIFKERKHKLRNIQQFQTTLVRFDVSTNGLEEFLLYYEYLKEHEFYDPTSDKVTLLTMHAAKGLEFSYVFICGFEEGSIPFIKTHDDADRLEEEKRLLYVAMTRAKQYLYLLYTKKRGGEQSKISRFHSLISAPQVEDEAIARIEKWKKKQKDKKSQMSLF